MLYTTSSKQGLSKIAFLLGSPDIGGGTYVIFQHACNLKSYGLDVTIITELPVENSRLEWFPKAKELKWETYEDIKEKHLSFDLCIATWWKTCLSIGMVTAKQYVYFVQSIESRFPNPEDVALIGLIESIYTLPFKYITEATWIQTYLKDKHDQKSYLVKNGIDKKYFKHDGEKAAPKSKNVRFLVEGPIDVAFKNVPKTISLLTESNAKEIWLLTSSSLNHYPGVDKVFSRIPINEVAKIYRSCDVIVKLSYVEGMFGPPLEMFHCGGTSIVYKVTGSEEYIVNGVNGIVIPKDDEKAVIEAINHLIEDTKYLNELKLNAQTTALNWPDWENSSKEYYTTLQAIFREETETNTTRIRKHVDVLYNIYVSISSHFNPQYKDSRNNRYLTRVKENLKKTTVGRKILIPIYMYIIYSYRYLKIKINK